MWHIAKALHNTIEKSETVDFKELQSEYPQVIINRETVIEKGTDIDYDKPVLISLVKNDNVDLFLDGSARIYYTGKKFPSTVALNKLYYFMPYLKKKGIRDLYFIRIARVGSKAEVHPDADANDLRLVFEIEKVQQLFDDYRPVTLKIWNTFTDTFLNNIVMLGG